MDIQRQVVLIDESVERTLLEGSRRRFIDPQQPALAIPRRPAPDRDLRRPRRKTNRYPYSDRMPSSSILARLADAVTQENALLRIYDDPDEVRGIVDLLRQHGDRWCRLEGCYRVRVSTVAQIAERGIGLRGHGSQRLSTRYDRPVDWVRAGQALERLLLVATNEGLVASFMNQPLEQDEDRQHLRSPLTGHGHTQMLMRIGYGVPVPPTPPMPRRSIADVVRRLEGSG